MLGMAAPPPPEPTTRPPAAPVEAPGPPPPAPLDPLEVVDESLDASSPAAHPATARTITEQERKRSSDMGLRAPGARSEPWVGGGAGAVVTRVGAQASFGGRP